MFIIIFSKCCSKRTIVSLLVLIIPLFATGCIEEVPSEASGAAEAAALYVKDPGSSGIDLDFQSSVSPTTSRTCGQVLLWDPLPYLLLTASLWNGEELVDRASYLLLDPLPGRWESFQIFRDLPLVEGEYIVDLEIEGPEGTIASGRRQCLEDWPRERTTIVFIESPRSASEDPEVVSMDLEEFLDQGINSSRDLVGSVTTKKYHRADCRYAAKIAEKNRVYFASSKEAIEAGFSPCKVCDPGD